MPPTSPRPASSPRPRHDLLQPLNAARLFLSALAETELPASAERLIENVELAFEIDRPAAQRAARHLEARCRRRHAGDRERAARPAAAPAGRRVRAAGRAQGAELRLVPTDAVVVTDPGHAHPALMNLVSNAIRYTRQGGVLIGVRRRRVGASRRGGRYRASASRRAARRDLRGVPPARQRRRPARPRLRPGARDRRADRPRAGASAERAVRAGPRLAVRARAGGAARRSLPATVAAPSRRRDPGCLAGDRERGRHPRGHAGAAAGLGLRGAHRRPRRRSPSACCAAAARGRRP